MTNPTPDTIEPSIDSTEEMADDTQIEPDEEVSSTNERSILMQRARLMGIKFSPNIGLETLKERIAQHQEGVTPKAEESEVPPEMEVPDNRSLTAQQLRRQIREDNLRLIRIRVTCLDPKKKDLPGEIFTIRNKFLGTVRKYVPYGDQTENGYHVPNCIYEMMKARKFLHIKVTKGRNGQDIVETSYVPEFALEVLPPLTREELNKLAAVQQARGKE